MKVKLLKKIRKRYTIAHYPNGRYIYGDWNSYPLTILEDREDSWRYIISTAPKAEAYAELMVRMRNWIEKDYKTSRKRKNIIEEILWYK
jgi:hypothetical protein